MSVTQACGLPAVTISASSTSITAGQSVNFTSSTTGGVTQYQWFIGASGDTSHPITGATGPSLTASPSTTTTYWLHVFNTCYAAHSNAITISVTQGCVLPTVTISASSTSITAGQSVNFTSSTTRSEKHTS